MQYKYFENTVRKGEIAHNKQFLLFPGCLLPFQRTFLIKLKMVFCKIFQFGRVSLKFVACKRVNSLSCNQIFVWANSVFHDPLVSLNFEGFDPQIFLNDPQNLLFTCFKSYGGGHCDPLNRTLRENPGPN